MSLCQDAMLPSAYAFLGNNVFLYEKNQKQLWNYNKPEFALRVRAAGFPPKELKSPPRIGTKLHPRALFNKKQKFIIICLRQLRIIS